MTNPHCNPFARPPPAPPPHGPDNQEQGRRPSFPKQCSCAFWDPLVLVKLQEIVRTPSKLKAAIACRRKEEFDVDPKSVRSVFSRIGGLCGAKVAD